MADIVFNLKEYEVTGTALDNAWVTKNRESIESYMREDMRAANIVPILDMESRITCNFNPMVNTFEFTIKMVGYEMKNAIDYLGIMLRDGIIIKSDTTKALIFEELRG